MKIFFIFTLSITATVVLYPKILQLLEIRNQLIQVSILTIIFFISLFTIKRNKTKINIFLRQKQREKKIKTIYAGAMVLFSFCGLIYVSSLNKFNLGIDVSKNKKNSLSHESQKVIEIIKKTKKNFIFKAYFTKPQKEEIFRDLITKYQQHGSNFIIRYYDPDKNILEAKKDGIENENIVIIEYNKKKRYLYNFSEYTLTNTLINIIKNRNSKTITLLTGNGEKSSTSANEHGISHFYHYLTKNGFNVEIMNLFEIDTDKKTDLIIIPSPKYNLEINHLKIIENLISKGSNLLVTQDALQPVDSLNILLEKYGLSFETNLLILEKNNVKANLFGQNTALITEFNEMHPVSEIFHHESTALLNIPDSRGISTNPKNINNRKILEIASTSKDTLVINNVFEIEDLQNTSPSQFIKNKKIFIASSSYENNYDKSYKNITNPKSRIIIIGSGKILTNKLFNKEINRNFLFNIINYLTDEDDLISLKTNKEDIYSLNISKSESVWILLFICFIYPFCFLIQGYYFWRKRTHHHVS